MKIVQKHPTLGVRESIREANRLLRLVAFAFAEWQTSHDLGSWSEFEATVDAALEFGLDETDTARAIVRR